MIEGSEHVMWDGLTLYPKDGSFVITKAQTRGHEQNFGFAF
jgi:hypothetical protein